MKRGEPETPALPRDERRQLTVMFTDVVGSTELASTLDPEDWHDVLDAYQHRVASIVRANGGAIAQFQGDGAVAYFGYPEAVESAGRDAVSAGLALVDDIARMGRELASTLRVEDLRARAGIHTGEVVVAAVTAGGNERLPDVWGPVPNLAARLQGACEPGQVVISGDTASLVSGYFELTSLGSLAVKGVAEPVPAFRAIRRSPARHRLEARPLTTFVSREDALAWLEDQWILAQEGKSRLALVTGEPGIGKSRLILEFSDGLATRGHDVHTLFCSRRVSLSPLQPFTEVMDASPATPADVAAWIEALGRLGPLLLVVEDVHWADPSTLEAVHLIARRTSPVFVLMSARPEAAENPQLRSAAHLVLERLSSDEAHEMLELLPESEGMAPDVRDALVRRAGGVPLFLEELARDLAESASEASEVEAAMPTTLFQVITARLDRLGVAKQVAQSAAVIGRTFERPVLRAVTALEDSKLTSDLNRLFEHAIVEPTSRADELQFRHALFHLASYRSVLRADRVRIHQAVGEVLVATGRAEVRPEIAAYHFGSAGRATEAVPLWQRAARTARQNARFREAAAHERAVLALVPELPQGERELVELKSRSRLVMCLTAVDQSNPEALAESERVEELARRLGQQGILLLNYLVLVPWWQASAQYERVDTLLEEARQIAESLGDDWSVRLVAMYEATARLWKGRPTEALALMRTTYAAIGIPLDGSLRDLPPMAPVELMAMGAPRVASAVACWQCGFATEAWHIANEVLRFTAESDVPQALALASVTAGIMAQLDGDRELVMKLANEACEVSDEVSTRQWRQWSQSLLWWAGDGLDEPELPVSHLRPYFLMLLADSPRMSDLRALSLLDEAIATARRSGEGFCEPEILRARGRVLSQAGRYEGARENYVEAVASARAQGARMLELRALTDWVRLPETPDAVRNQLHACAVDVARGGPCRSLTEALSALAPA